MLEQLQSQPADALLALIKMHADDEREDKIDLGVGVYRTGEGATPVFSADQGRGDQAARSAGFQELPRSRGRHGLCPGADALRLRRGTRPWAGALPECRPPAAPAPSAWRWRWRSAPARAASIWACRAGRTTRRSSSDLGMEVAAFDHANADGSANLAALIAAIDGAAPRRSGAAAWLLPQSHRDRLHPRGLAGHRRGARAHRRAAAAGHRLSGTGPWAWTRTSPGCAACSPRCPRR